MPHAAYGALVNSSCSQPWANLVRMPIAPWIPNGHAYLGHASFVLPIGCQHCLRGTPISSRARNPVRGRSHQHASRVHAAAAPDSIADSIADLKQLRQTIQDSLNTPPSTIRAKADSPQVQSSPDTLSAASKSVDTSKLPAPGEADKGFLGQSGSPAGPATESTAQAVKDQAKPAAEAVASQVQDATPGPESISQSLQSSASSPGNAAGSAQSAAQSVGDQLKSSSALPSTDFAPGDAVKDLSQQVNDATSSAVQSVQGSLQEASDTVLNQFVPGLQSSIESAAAQVSNQVNEATSSLLQALPPEISDRLQAAAATVDPTVKEVSTYFYSDPKAGAAAATVAVGLPLFVYYQARLSGYAGQLAPLKAKAFLNRKNTLLIDIRKEAMRNTRGVPLLKRRSRGKGAAIEIQSITSSSARSSRQGQTLGLEITALQIVGLKQVNKGTGLVIMDQSGGSEAVAIARFIRQLSRRKVYVLEGGFSAWEKKGLEVQSSEVNYKTTVFDSLSDEAENLVESASSVFRDPVVAAGGIGGVVLAGVALIDWHFTLQYIGILGAQLSLIKWFTSYESAEDAFADVQASAQQIIQKVTGVFNSGRQAVFSTTQKPDMSYKQLPTSGEVEPEQTAETELPNSRPDQNSQQSATRT